MITTYAIPMPDEFGRMPEFTKFETYKYASWDCNHEKYFSDRTEAFDFYRRAQNEAAVRWGNAEGDSTAMYKSGDLDRVKIDSIYYDRDASDTLAVFILTYPDWRLDSIVTISISDTIQIQTRKR